MQPIEVNTNLLSKQISELNENISGLESSTHGLEDVVDGLKTMWTGPAQEMFYIQFYSDKEKMEELLTLLQKITDEFQNACTEYNKCDDSVGSIVSSLVN